MPRHTGGRKFFAVSFLAIRRRSLREVGRAAEGVSDDNPDDSGIHARRLCEQIRVSAQLNTARGENGLECENPVMSMKTPTIVMARTPRIVAVRKRTVMADLPDQGVAS